MNTFEIFSAGAARFFNKGKIMLYSTLALGVILAAAPVHVASAAGCGTVHANSSCTQFGATELSDDCTDILACLSNTPGSNSGNLFWKAGYGGGDGGGSYVVDTSSGCIQPNPMSTPSNMGLHTCTCPSGFTASPANVVPQNSATPSTPGTTGYICNKGTATLQTRWMGESQNPRVQCWQTNPSSPPSACTSTYTGALPCTPGQSTYTVLQCDYGTWADCPGNQQGWTVQENVYDCTAY